MIDFNYIIISAISDKILGLIIAELKQTTEYAIQYKRYELCKTQSITNLLFSFTYSTTNNNLTQIY